MVCVTACVCVCASARSHTCPRRTRAREQAVGAVRPGAGGLGQTWGGGRGSARPGSRPLGASGPAMGRVLL